MQEQRKKNLERLADALSEYDDMKRLDDKISDIWKLPEFSAISQDYDNSEDIDDSGVHNNSEAEK